MKECLNDNHFGMRLLPEVTEIEIVQFQKTSIPHHRGNWTLHGSGGEGMGQRPRKFWGGGS